MLRPGGRLVFSMLHPARAPMQRRGSDPGVRLFAPLEGQPAPHLYFVRTTEQVFGACRDAGLRLVESLNLSRDGSQAPLFVLARWSKPE
jgi:hypothetical protein